MTCFSEIRHYLVRQVNFYIDTNDEVPDATQQPQHFKIMWCNRYL